MYSSDGISNFGYADRPKVSNKKQRDNAAQDAEMKRRKEERATREQEDETPEASGPTDLLAAEGDEDVIF